VLHPRARRPAQGRPHPGDDVGLSSTTRLWLSVVVAATLTLALWLTHSESSPLHEFSIWHPSIGNVLGFLGVPSLILGVAASGNAHQPSEGVFYVLFLVQWLGLSYLALTPVSRRSTRS
jgi:hypothetical protein